LLHVVENMHDQAVENWIFRIMRDSRSRYPDFHWTFYSALGQPGRLDDSVRELGGEVIHSPVPVGNTRKFISELHNTIERGRFDVMHAHHDIMSAVYLLAAARTPIRRRIVHVHNTSMELPTPSKMKRAMVWEPMRRVCLTMSDRIAGISRDALSSMIAGAAPKPGRDVVVYYGIDTTKFRNPKRTPAETRASIGVAPNAKMILFGGRMTQYKNPRFVIEVLAEIADAEPSAVAVFAGVGTETDTVRQLAQDTGLADRVRILGWRDDLAELMLAADLLLWPGQEVPKEGLGLGIVEAQAAGLPIIMSRSVPEDAVVIDELVSILPLALGPEAWGRETLKRLRASHLPREESLERIEASHFSLTAGTDNVMALYQNLPTR
jgi:glycosyltransferase involved in cell wall biosynthesis